MAGRPKQPRCEHCGKALYKRMDPGQVRKSDPYAWCRNKACSHYNTDPSGASRFAPLGGVEALAKAPVKRKPKPKAKKPKAVLAWPVARSEADAELMRAIEDMPDGPDRIEAHARLAATIEVALKAKAAEDAAPDIGGDDLAQAIAEAKAEASEPEAVSKARSRIRKVVEAAESQFGPQAIGLALAIVTQETGNNEAANHLIQEYDLELAYGIEAR